MLSHVGIEVGDLERSRVFYEGALAPLGIEVVMEFEGAVGFGKEAEQGPNPFFWLNARGRPPVSGAHVCFGARTTDLVDAFHAAAIAVGGTDNGAPGPRPQYHPGLLRRLRPRPRRQQRRGRLPPGGDRLTVSSLLLIGQQTRHP